MNIFIAIMLVFAAAGLLDEILGGKLGLMPNFEKGLATMGGLAMSTVGFYAIGVTYVQTHAEAIAEAAKHMPFDPALIPSCLLAPDMGALGMAQKLAATPALAAFTGAMVAGSLGMTVEQVKELKAAVIRGAAAEQKVRELKVENQQLQQKIPSMKEKLKEAQERQRLENENRQLKVQVEYLEKDLSWERGISARLQEGIGAVLDFLDQHLPEQFRPLVEKARELLPVPEVQQPEKEQERGHTWGGMEL